VFKLKNFIYIWFAALFIVYLASPIEASAQTLDIKAESAIIVDANTGQILYAKNENEALPPASMTKMMTEYIVLEKVANGEISWDDKTEISDFVYEISGNDSFSGIGLRKNVEYSIKDLFDAMVINSDNATTIALAEYIAGSEGEFVKLMNQKAEELGLSDYKFVNSTGLDNASLNGKHPEGTNPDDTNLLSAKSTAQLAYRLINDYPESLETSKIPQKQFEDQTILNWNWMLPHDREYLKEFYYEGVDGLKTGHTELAKYAFTSTAKRGDERLITVVMKADSIEERFKETAKLLDYGFDQFETVELFPKGFKKEGESTVPVEKGKAEQVEVELAEPLNFKIKKGTNEDYDIQFVIDEDKLNENGALEAPIEKGEKIGVAKLVYNDSTAFPFITDDKKEITVDLVAAETVEKKNWFSLMISAIVDFFKDLF